jgi:hypothetical protein
MAALYGVQVTENFERNLNDIETFLAEAEATSAFDNLLDELIETVIPNLERFPDIGRNFLAQQAGSVEVLNGLERLGKKLADLGTAATIREYMCKHQLILYAVSKCTVYLLSIRHFKQLSFDFESQ